MWLPLDFRLFALALAFFHCSEFVLVAVLNRTDLSRKSWLLSQPYCIAMVLACVEYWTELWLCPGLKATMRPTALVLGIAAVAGGELLRKTAMIVAARSFTHMIATTKQPEHRLVTRGPYACMRHPGYAGWLAWAVGTQLLLANPLCTLGFAAVTWRFFRERIEGEEHYLARFFGPEWAAYRAATCSGIPGIP